jgi:hypothetical protein
VLHREVVLAMPIEVNDLRTVLDRKTDPHVDIAVVNMTCAPCFT